jgi:hypothetical protein
MHNTPTGTAPVVLENHIRTPPAYASLMLGLPPPRPNVAATAEGDHLGEGGSVATRVSSLGPSWEATWGGVYDLISFFNTCGCRCLSRPLMAKPPLSRTRVWIGNNTTSFGLCSTVVMVVHEMDAGTQRFYKRRYIPASHPSTVQSLL